MIAACNIELPELPGAAYDGRPWLVECDGIIPAYVHAWCDAKAHARGGEFKASYARDFIEIRFVTGKRRVREPHETVVHHSRSGFGFSIGAVR